MANTGDHRTRGGRAGGGPPEAGSVTAELAVGLPGVVATVLLVIGAMVAATTYVECYEAARSGVRAAMIGGTESASEAARTVAGPRADVSVQVEGEWVDVEVSKQVITGTPVRVTARMSGLMEPGFPAWPGAP